MCLEINPDVKSLNKRIVWKVFDKLDGKIVSLFQAATYPKGKLVTRDAGTTNKDGRGYHGLHFFVSKATAKREAQTCSGALTLEYRAIAFTYCHGIYERVTDMFDHGYKTQEERYNAARAGVRAVNSALADGDGVIGACVAVPVLPTT